MTGVGVGGGLSGHGLLHIEGGGGLGGWRTDLAVAVIPSAITGSVVLVGATVCVNVLR